MKTGKVVVTANEDFYYLTDVAGFLKDPTKAKNELEWGG